MLALPFGHDIWVIGGLLVVLSVLATFESPTVQACIPQMLSGYDLMRGNAVVSQIQAIAGLITPFLGSLVYAAFGLTPVLWGTVVCFFLTAVLERFIRLNFQKVEGTQTVREIIREDFAVSLRFLSREQPDILKLLLLAALASLFVTGTGVVGFPYLVRTLLGLPAEYYGAAESIMGVAAVLGSLFVALTAQEFRLRWLAVVFLGLGLILIPAGAAFLLPLGPRGVYGILLVLFSLVQFGCSLFSTCSISVIQARTPEHLMGKVMSYVVTLAMCAQPVGQILYGALFDQFSDSPYWMLIPSGLLVCGIALAASRFFANFERQDARRPSRPD